MWHVLHGQIENSGKERRDTFPHPRAFLANLGALRNPRLIYQASLEAKHISQRTANMIIFRQSDARIRKNIDTKK